MPLRLPILAQKVAEQTEEDHQLKDSQHVWAVFVVKFTGTP